MRTELQTLIDRCIHYRGYILNRCTILESDIELYVLYHFSSTKNVLIDLHQTVLQKLTFDAKISTFQEILNRNVGDEIFEKKYSKLFIELRYIKDVRNKMAHWPMFVGYKSNEKIPKEFSLISYYNSMENKPYTKGDFELFNKRMDKCIEVIEEVTALFGDGIS